MDAQYLAEEVERLEASERYLRGRYEHFQSKYEEQIEETRKLVKILECYRGIAVPGVGLLADGALDKLWEKERGKKRPK